MNPATFLQQCYKDLGHELLERRLTLPDGRVVTIDQTKAIDPTQVPRRWNLEGMVAGEVFSRRDGDNTTFHIVANDERGNPKACVQVTGLFHETDGLIEGPQTGRYIGFTQNGQRGRLVFMGTNGLKLEVDGPLMPMPIGPEITDETPLDEDTLSGFNRHLLPRYNDLVHGTRLDCRETFRAFCARIAQTHGTVGKLKQELGIH